MKANHSGVDYKEGLKKQSKTPSKIKQAHTRSMENGCCRQFRLLFLTLSFTLTQRFSFGKIWLLPFLWYAINPKYQQQPKSSPPRGFKAHFDTQLQHIDTGLQSFVSICYQLTITMGSTMLKTFLWESGSYWHDGIIQLMQICIPVAPYPEVSLLDWDLVTMETILLTVSLFFFKRPVWALCILLEAPLEDGCTVVIKG